MFFELRISISIDLRTELLRCSRTLPKFLSEFFKMGSPIVHLETWTPGFIRREINVVWIAATRWIFNICIRLAVWGVFDKADIGLISRKASDESAPNCRFGANIFWCGGNWSTRIPNIFLQTTFLQVSRVRRGATQRDYRLLYYKVFRFPENPEPRHFFLKIDYVL